MVAKTSPLKNTVPLVKPWKQLFAESPDLTKMGMTPSHLRKTLPNGPYKAKHPGGIEFPIR